MKRSIAIIQARSSSKRLPRKALLKIDGINLVVITAKRVANTGRKVIVATSCDPSDDYLCKILKKEKIKFCRGSLDDVLSRFIKTLENYNGNKSFFRLTADNLFVDGSLLDEIEDEFFKKKYQYLTTGTSRFGLPDGIGVEISLIKYLRKAHRNTKLKYDREHVTPYLKRNLKISYYSKYKYLKMGLYFCTIDYMKDFKKIRKIFSITKKKEKKNIIQISWLDLVKNLKKFPK